MHMNMAGGHQRQTAQTGELLQARPAQGIVGAQPQRGLQPDMVRIPKLQARGHGPGRFHTKCLQAAEQQLAVGQRLGSLGLQFGPTQPVFPLGCGPTRPRNAFTQIAPTLQIVRQHHQGKPRAAFQHHRKLGAQ